MIDTEKLKQKALGELSGIQGFCSPTVELPWESMVDLLYANLDLCTEVENLRAELATVTKERDAAVAQLRNEWCLTCVGCEAEPAYGDIIKDCKSWLMRGVQNG